jgi:hypothetical protein
MESLLQATYYALNSGGGFQSLSRFGRAVRAADGSIPWSAIRSFYERQTVTQLSKARKRPPLYRHFLFPSPNRWLGMDGMHVRKSGKWLPLSPSISDYTSVGAGRNWPMSAKT